MNTDYVLEMKNISKQYGENAVLQGVSLSVKKGEIHALLGENGAGKSTLMNVLFGMPVIHNTGGFEGSVYLNGEETRILSPHDAMEKGHRHGASGVHAAPGLYHHGEYQAEP